MILPDLSGTAFLPAEVPKRYRKLNAPVLTLCHWAA